MFGCGLTKNHYDPATMTRFYYCKECRYLTSCSEWTQHPRCIRPTRTDPADYWHLFIN